MLDRRLLDEGFMSKDLNKFETQGAAVMIQALEKLSPRYVQEL